VMPVEAKAAGSGAVTPSIKAEHRCRPIAIV
jgi:hypothetical protein